MRSKNIKFDVIEGQLASNKISDIKRWLTEKESISSRIIFTGQEEDKNEAKSFLIKKHFYSFIFNYSNINYNIQ